MTDNDSKELERIGHDDRRSHQTPQEQGAWVQFAAAALAAQTINTRRPDVEVIRVCEAHADDLVAQMRRRDRTYDGEPVPRRHS